MARTRIALLVGLLVVGHALANAVVPVRLARAAPDVPEVVVDVRARLAEGRRAYVELEYRAAIRVLASVSRDPAATNAQRIEALELLGISFVVVGNEESAREAFGDLLAIDPGYVLREESGSPHILRVYEQVRRVAVPTVSGQRVSLEHAAPVSGAAGRHLEIVATVTRGVRGSRGVYEVVLRHRKRGTLEYRELAMLGLDGARHRARFTLPADDRGYQLEYYLEARDLAGRQLARIGGPDLPLSLPIAGGTTSSRSTRWLLVGAGGVLVGAAAIAVLLATGGESAPDGTLGTVGLGR